MYQLFTIVLLLGAHLAHQTLDKWAWSGAELGPVRRRGRAGALYRGGLGLESSTEQGRGQSHVGGGGDWGGSPVKRWPWSGP